MPGVLLLPDAGYNRVTSPEASNAQRPSHRRDEVFATKNIFSLSTDKREQMISEFGGESSQFGRTRFFTASIKAPLSVSTNLFWEFAKVFSASVLMFSSCSEPSAAYSGRRA